MKSVLPSLISPTQSAFVLGRLIQDNSITALEIMHSMKIKAGTKGLMALKMDMSQAYDRLEWNFIFQCLHGFGFCEGWINLISQCITSVSYSFLHNGSPFGCIVPSRSLRQGDPLFLFLFILASKALTRLFIREERLGSIHGVRAARGAPLVSHLMFADHLVVFCRANIREARVVDTILQTYCGWSGQLVNKHKSAIYFSPNTLPEVIAAISDVLHLKRMKSDCKYLGLPMFWGKSKKTHFSEMQDRIQAKVAGWKCKSLSQAGRTVLIKSVATALPLPQYYMQSLHFPLGWYAKVDKILKDFWWGHSVHKARNYTPKRGMLYVNHNLLVASGSDA